MTLSPVIFHVKSGKLSQYVSKFGQISRLGNYHPPTVSAFVGKMRQTNHNMRDTARYTVSLQSYELLYHS